MSLTINIFAENSISPYYNIFEINGIYTTNTIYTINTNNTYSLSYYYLDVYLEQISFKNIIITSSGDTSLATTLYLPDFNMTLYPVLNGSNITIVGGVTSTANSGYTYTFVGAQFPISCTTFTLYFAVSSTPTETSYSLIQ